MKKEKWQLKMTRRQVLKAGMIGGAGLMMPLRFLPAKAFAAPAATGLHDPAWQFSTGNAFTKTVPDALDPTFKYTPWRMQGKVPFYRVGAGYVEQKTGLVDAAGDPLTTPVWGYGQIDGAPWYSWPGRTFEVQAGHRTVVQWSNNLPIGPHLLPYDPNLHYAYSLHGYTGYTIEANGTPIVMHLHGGHNKDLFDGNPEQFFSPGGPGVMVTGPRFQNNEYVYDNDRPAGNLWYHDHGLGITRINVYAGLAGFYFVRDENDTGRPGNPLNLPAWPYEKAYAIQCRMFDGGGNLFYPAFPGDPAYSDFIETPLPSDKFPDNPNSVPGFDGGGPTALAEFFGDHMMVNGVPWPMEEVEPRPYRIHLLNGTDSRFMGIRFRVVGAANADPAITSIPAGTPTVPFWVIGSDQGLASSPSMINGRGYLVFEPGSRYDIIIDFSKLGRQRIIMENIGADEPFDGNFPNPDDRGPFKYTDRIMAFDVVKPRGFFDGNETPPVHPLEGDINFGPDVPATDPDRVRKVALFEGRDEFNRLQPLLGTAEPATDFRGRPINWPNTQPYIDAGLVGQMEGAIAWHSPTTENPALKSIEEWEVWNLTGDAHPIHLHLVHFEVLGRREIVFDDNADEDGFLQTALELKTTLSSKEETQVIVTTAIPDKVSDEGTLRVVDDQAVERDLNYSSYSGDTFVLDGSYDFLSVNATSGNDVLAPTDPVGNGAGVVPQPVVQHNGEIGRGYKIIHPEDPNDAYGPEVLLGPSDGYVENTPKDMVTALPLQITRIKAVFDKPGRYVWHCHILSHEDHEMMRVLHVGGGQKDPSP